MIIYIKNGDIFELEGVTNFAHGCNCSGAMGKGIALQFKNRFPEMYIEYKKLCKEGLFTLGNIFIYKHEKGFIFNLGTQANWKTKADLKAIETSFLKMLEYSNQNNITMIALPKIGAGLGGLDWENVKKSLTKISLNYPRIQLYIVENYKLK